MVKAQKRRRILLAVAIVIAGIPVFVAGSMDGKFVQQQRTTRAWREVRPMPTAAMQLAIEGQMPSLSGATAWLNSPPLTAAGLRGKVVLIEIWTYTCINWRRQLPYVRAWAGKYKDHGLVVIGVHSPEFEFEKNLDNVRRAAKETNVDYPIAVDSDYAIWKGLNNEYWPALYFIDAKGQIRYHHFGEGEYDESELVLQQLLVEAGSKDVPRDLVAAEGRGAEAPPDWGDLQSAENYVGYQRTENFASPGGPVPGRAHIYVAPTRLPLNNWALSGHWIMNKGDVLLDKTGDRILYRFHARDLHLVMGPAKPGVSLRFRVLMDGKSPGNAHGVDVDSDGNGTLTEPRMYQLIRQQQPIVDRQFEIEFLDPGAQVFSFTFG